MRILVIEDSQNLAKQLKSALERARYAVDLAADGEEGQHLGDTEPYDAVILDLGLPKRDGLMVLENWRANGNLVPVLILTSRITWRERVAGLRAGADDYLVKPFQYEELLARLEALIRRSTGHADPIFTCGPITLDTAHARVTVDGNLINLTALEYRMLDYLVEHKGKVVSKAALTEHIYNQDFNRDSNVIEVLVNRLRKKIGPNLIWTRRGLGYELSEDGPSG